MTAPLRNDWKSSLEKGIALCKQHGHRGDAETIKDVIDHLEGPNGVSEENRVKTQKENAK